MAKQSEILSSFRERLTYLMEVNRWNVPELSENTGIKYATLRGILGKDLTKTGKDGPSFKLIHTMVTKLRSKGISADWLITGEDPPSSVKSAQPEDTDPGIEQPSYDGETEDLNFGDGDVLDAAYREVATAAKEIIDMTMEMPDTYMFSLMKQLKSCFLIQEHLEIRRKKQRQIKNALIGASKSDNQLEKIK